MNPQTLPATCELCGSWLPEHSSGCPRNGVHPSQWRDIHQIIEEQLLDVNSQGELLDNDDELLAVHTIAINTD